MTVFPDHKQQIASDLNQLALLLNDAYVCEDVKPLYDAAEKCDRKSNSEKWVYEIENLVFSIPNMGHVIPFNASLIRVVLSMTIEGKYYFDKIITNPVTYCTINIEILGSVDDYDDLHASWHLDNHISHVGDGLNKFIHPNYHFKFGGNRMWDKAGMKSGSLIILPTPRLNHSPLDGILAVDFIIQNYLRYEDHLTLTQNQEYKNILYNSQFRLWRPYYCAIAENWKEFENACDESISPHLLMPNIVKL